MSGDYADELTGFEQRLLDGLREVRTGPPRRPRRNWRPVVVLAATAAAVLGAAVVVPSAVDRPVAPAPPLAQPVAAKPFSYVRAVQGTRYVTMEGGGEVWSEIRASAELWSGNQPSGTRPLRVALGPYAQFSCTSSVSDALCDDWLGRHGEIEANREPIDRLLPSVPYPVEPDDTDLPNRVRPLLPDTLVLDAALPADPVALDAEATELAGNWHDRFTKPPTVDEIQRQQLKWHLLVEVAGKPAASPELRSAAFGLARALPIGRADSGTDRLGRTGTRLSLGQDGDLRTEVIFDPVTATVLSVENFLVVPPDTRRPPIPLVAGTYTLFERTGTVGSTSERP